MKNWIFVNNMIFCWMFWCVDWNFWRFVWYFSFFDRHFDSISNELNESLMFYLYCVCFEFQSIWNDEFKFFSNRMFRALKRVWIDWIWFVVTGTRSYFPLAGIPLLKIRPHRLELIWNNSKSHAYHVIFSITFFSYADSIDIFYISFW